MLTLADPHINWTKEISNSCGRAPLALPCLASECDNDIIPPFNRYHSTCDAVDSAAVTLKDYSSFALRSQ